MKFLNFFIIVYFEYSKSVITEQWDKFEVKFRLENER